MKIFFLILCVLLSNSSLARTVKTFAPVNNLHEEDGLVDNGMTEAMFDSIIDQVEKFYAPIVNQFNANLVINHLWNDSTVNAQAYQEGSTWYVDMFGGLARREEITPDGFAMVVCHELGHHLGGFPFVQSWAANEGQSDYWALYACAKNIWANQSMEVTKVSKTAKSICDNSKTEDKNFCYRQLNAGYSLANLLGVLGGTKVSFDTPDKTQVRRTNNRHPNAQCRLDTYIAGSLCKGKWNDTLIPQNETESAKYICTQENARPRCWFKPSK